MKPKPHSSFKQDTTWHTT